MQKNKKYFGLMLIIILLVLIIFRIRKSKQLNGIYEKEFTEGEAEILDEQGKIKKIRVDYSGWFEPYNENRRTNLIKLTKHLYGVYCIRKKSNNEIIYIGHSSNNLYKALYRHFQYYNDIGIQHRIYYENPKKYQVCVILTSKTNAYQLEQSLIKQYQPKDAYMKYENAQLNILTDVIEEIETIEAPF